MTEGQVATILLDLGIDVVSEHETHYSVRCPFHTNVHTPAATVAKSTGYFWCFNGACAKRLPLEQLIRKLKRLNYFECLRYIERHETDRPLLADQIREIYAHDDELAEFNSDLLTRLQGHFNRSNRAQQYMESRGINLQTAQYFGMAYDPTRDMVCTPMYSDSNICVGIIGRSIVDKEFKNSLNLPTSKTLFNIYNAKRSGEDYLILVESNFDAQRVKQAGFENVCATIGGTFSQYHVSQVYRYFSKIILLTDADEPGIKFAQRIARRCNKFGVAAYRGKYDEYNLFPNGAKDVCDSRNGRLLVPEKDIRTIVQNAQIIVQ